MGGREVTTLTHFPFEFAVKLWLMYVSPVDRMMFCTFPMIITLKAMPLRAQHDKSEVYHSEHPTANEPINIKHSSLALVRSELPTFIIPYIA